MTSHMDDLPPKKRVPPARRKYERDNPAITVRISQDLHDRLRNTARTSRLTLKQVFEASMEKGLTFADAYQRGYPAALTACLELFPESSEAWSEVCELLPLDEAAPG